MRIHPAFHTKRKIRTHLPPGRYSSDYPYLVRVARLERAASTSQMSRATNCTTPGYLVVMIIARKSCDSKSFPVCGHLCGQARFLPRFCQMRKSRKRPCCKGFRTLAVPIVDTRRIAPKSRALPTALHPDINFQHQNKRY